MSSNTQLPIVTTAVSAPAARTMPDGNAIRPPRILFIGNDMTRSGAPAVLLHLLTWLKGNTDWAFSVATPLGGSSLDAFRALAPAVVCEMPPLGAGAAARNSGRLLRRLGVGAAIKRRRLRSAVAKLPGGRFDLVYCNSVAGIGLVSELGPLRCPVIVHVHELQYVLENMTWVKDAPALMSRLATHYIACAPAVRENLIARQGVTAERITVVPECVDVAAVRKAAVGASPEAFLASRAATLAQVGLTPEAMIVGVVGTVEWRKGADLLVPLARAVQKRGEGRRIGFIWVGGGAPDAISQTRHDIQAAGLSADVKLVGPSDRMGDWLRCFDIFALLSREDPFPLAALEAAAVGKPIVCFQGAGGMPDFVQGDAGVTAPMLDLETFADAIVRMISDDSLRETFGATAAARVAATCDVSVICPQLRDIISAELKRVGPGRGVGNGR